ncbi:unnamed protein product [Effrenium voratum]|uniref:EF-hand domain-containing protein n=1 Tax=Effrenium voratum TaxID=2562239 RepID=A0AA36IYX3_9DINO|nr:unnamed protein product [Effrenium voratum]CAJ1396542.1 unnamed protein product [Effrenium voratum]CAJ1415490.1 unnamed protein product [Effrenium voratum]
MTSRRSSWDEADEEHSLAMRKAITMLRNYLYKKEASILKSWFKHFDSNMNGIMEKSEFLSCVSKMSYPGNIQDFWNELELPDAETISLREINEDLAALWSHFRKFCGCTFLGAKDLLVKLTSKEDEKRPSSIRAGSQPLLVDAPQWVQGLRNLGWMEGYEEMLFEALDLHDEGLLGQRNFHWLEPEVRRHLLKCEAKKKAAADQKVRVAARRNRQQALIDFKSYIRRHFGESYHAWRRALDVDGTMNLQRPELFKVCRTLGWRGDVRLLWQALDVDGAGTCSLQELDPRCARQLAKFRRWAEGKFGSKPAQALWKALDRHGKFRLSLEAFCQNCRRLGLDSSEQQVKEIAVWLDWEEKKTITLDDLLFLDIWKPPAYLVAEPNPEAAVEIRRLLHEKHGHPLRAWRLMDKDNSNTCNWYEFLSAVKAVSFEGDAAGAWMALDEDLSGAISLAEIDANANSMLIQLKQWADQEFGGVRAAFRVLDKDKSGELSMSEFRTAVLIFGFAGEEVTLFRCLDVNGQGRLQLHEVHFLDDWEVPNPADLEAPELPERSASRLSRLSRLSRSSRRPESQSIVEYSTLGPGPGSYSIASTFAPRAQMPTHRHRGASTFRPRPEVTFLGKLKKGGAGPSSPAPVAKRVPAWGFGTTPREKAEPTSPGPGSYEGRAGTPRGPKFTLGTRRTAKMHPLAPMMMRTM